MKPRIQETMGFNLTIQVPESVEEFNTLAKAAPNTNPCLDAANDQIVFHDTLGSIRSDLVRTLNGEGDHGKEFRSRFPNVPSRRVVGKTPKGGDILEKESVYLGLVRESGSISPEDLAAEAQKVADRNPFDPSSSTSASQVAKRYYLLAEATKSAIDAGKGSWPTFVEKFSALNPGFEFEFDADGTTPKLDSVAAAYKANEVREAKESANKVSGFIA